MAGLVLLGVTAGARQERPSPQARFRTGVEVVHLDVTVLDEDRRPVSGLTADDFTILEDDRPQKIVAFKAIDIHEPPAPPAGWMRDVAPDVRSNADFDDRRLLVLVLDDALTTDLRSAANVKTAARRIVDELGPADLAAVAFTLRSGGAQEFTADKTRLLGAIDRFAPGFGGTGSWLYRRYSIKTIRLVTEALATIPERRKAIVYVGVGIPLDLSLLSTPEAIGSPSTEQGEMGVLLSELLEVFRQSERANVNVYAVDATGLARNVNNLRQDFLQALSANTGGYAVVNTSDFGPGVRQIFRENGSYYLVGYERATPAAEGRFHRIDVRVNRPNVTVRARRGYFAPRADRMAAPDPSSAPPEPASALADILPKTEVPLEVAAAPVALAAGKQVALALALGVRPTPVEDGSLTEHIDVLVGAYDPRGDPAGERRRLATVDPMEDAGARIEIPVRLDVEPGRYQLRLAVQLWPSGLTGSVFTDVDVPDFRKESVSLSGVVLGEPAAATTEPDDDGLGALVPLRPSVRRTFARDERVTAYLRVYQGGNQAPAPVTLAVRIVDATDTAVLDTTETLVQGRFDATRAAEYWLDLPLSRLPAGPYLLTLEATLGRRSARRDVRFSVK